MLAGLAERLSAELSASLVGTASVWKPKVLARGDRRYASWYGGATLAAMSACAAGFVRRDEYALSGAGDRLGSSPPSPQEPCLGGALME